MAAVPLIIGSNSFEASLMATFKVPAPAILAMAPPALKAAYAEAPDDTARAQAMFTDAFMGAPARWIAGKAPGPARLYHFAYVASMLRGHVPGAGHDTEIPFVFDSWDHLGALVKALRLTDEDRAMTRLTHGCWVAFAQKANITGDPACADWPLYDRATDRLLLFDSPATAVRSGFRKAQYDAQEAAVLPRLGAAR